MSRPAVEHVRGVLVALHLLAISLIAFPAPGGAMNQSSWKDPTVQAELGAWRARLASVGWELTPEEFEAGLWAWASSFMDARTAVLAPFQPYYRYCGTWQSWRMFVAPHRFPAVLELDVEQGGEWVPIYRARSSTHDWRKSAFDHERMRSLVFRMGWPKYGREWRRFGAWAANEVARDYPDASQLRARFFKYRTLSAAERLEGVEVDGRYERPLLFQLDERR